MSMKIKKSMGIMKLQKDKSFNFVKDFIKSFKKKIKYKKKIIPLHEPFFDKAEKKYVLECIKSTFVSTRGQMVKRFEEEIRKITNFETFKTKLTDHVWQLIKQTEGIG